jgi:uncharacterized DUF497 family protein
MAERQLRVEWVEATVHSPAWQEPDPVDATVQRRFAVIADRGDRILRVVCVETDTEFRVLSAFLDRRAKRPT